MSLLIRKFQPEDAGEASRIHYEAFKTYLKDKMPLAAPFPAEVFARDSVKKGPEKNIETFVAAMDGKIVGFLRAEVDFKKKKGGLHMVAVDPGLFAAGVGTALYEAAEKYWRENGMNQIVTCVSSINSRARLFYEKMGFVCDHIEKDLYIPGVDESILYKNLEGKQKND